MAYNQATFDRLKRWADYNYAPTRPLPPALGPPAEPSAEFQAELDRVGRTLTPPPTTTTAAKPARGEPTFTTATLFTNAALATLRAASYGPLTAPWRLASWTIQNSGTQPAHFIAITATTYDATGLQADVSGIDLLNAFSTQVAGSTPPPPLVPLGLVNSNSPLLLTAPSAWIPPGYFLTVWSDARTAAAGLNLLFIGSIEEARGVDFSEAPDLTLLRARPRVPPPPAPRSIIPQPPQAVMMTVLGVSRIIPWAFVAPALQREYIVNLVNGRATAGMTAL